MARTGRELAIVHGPQLTRQRLLGDRDAKLLPDPLDEVDQTPAHHAVDGRNGPLLDDGLQGRTMRVGEFRGLAGRLAVDQALGPMGVELHPPVAHDLNRDPADPGRRGAGRPLIDRGQRQKAPRLRAVLRRAGNRAQRMGIKVCPERNRHGEPPSFATLNQTCLKPTRPNRVTPSGTWYEPLATRDQAQPGWRATWPRSHAARRSPRVCGADPLVRSCPWAGTPQSAAPGPSMLRPSASLLLPSRGAKRPSSQSVQARTGPRELRYELLEKFDPFGREFGRIDRPSRDVATWMSQARHQAIADSILATRHDNRDVQRCLERLDALCSGRDDHVNFGLRKLPGQ